MVNTKEFESAKFDNDPRFLLVNNLGVKDFRASSKLDNANHFNVEKIPNKEEM